MTDRELMKWALYALEGSNAYDWPVVEELKERLAQPEPAPGYCKHCKQYSIEEPLPSQTEQKPVFELGFGWLDDAAKYPRGTKLYTVQRQWQGLTEKEAMEAVRVFRQENEGGFLVDFARAIEAKLKAKNA